MTGIGIPAVRSPAEVLRHGRDIVGPALHAAVDTLPGSVRHMAGYHFGWWDEAGRPTHGDGGKGLRSALVLLAAEVAGVAGAAAADATAAAAAVELVHNHSLVHDDVMDGDRTRRHRATTWSVFGVNAAIQAGNALLTLAFDVLAGSGHPAALPGSRMLHAAALSIVEGQVMDLAFERRDDVTRSVCLRMTRAKTAALMGCACALGGLYGGANREQVEHLRAFGEHLGMAFQHDDDLLGIWGDPKVTGKPVHSDLRRRKKSLPVVAALTSDSPAGQELAARYRYDHLLSNVDLGGLAELVDEAGGRAWSLARIGDELDRARQHLRSARLASHAAGELDALARLVTSRSAP